MVQDVGRLGSMGHWTAGEMGVGPRSSRTLSHDRSEQGHNVEPSSMVGGLWAPRTSGQFKIQFSHSFVIREPVLTRY